ncbi:MAG: proline dehydrogenase family protein [Acidobacteriaceae bacterium]|jgi:proline dehydrogenase|nr:proline dehydrogenase family protein [Acidobacteriaceae bacterium]
MIDQASKAFFHRLARSSRLKTLASRYGMKQPESFARRFIAGETIDEAIQAARQIEGKGLLHTLDYLGESVGSLEEADAVSREYLRIMDVIVGAGIGRNISLKLTQLGLDLDRARARDHLRRILDHADGFFVRVDMENSPYTAVTLDTVRTLWEQGYRQIGVVLQADLKRSEQDVKEIAALGMRVRLVKGAYLEPAAVAYTHKADVDAAYRRMLEHLLTCGHYPAIATHDTRMIAHTIRVAETHAIARDRFEFQMLYGIRRDMQEQLVRDGYQVRVYIPFGREWFPYFMRRLGERPANLAFVLRGMIGEGLTTS